MTNIEENRDRFLKEFKTIFVASGWKFQTYKGENAQHARKEVAGLILSFVFDTGLVQQMTKEPTLRFAVGLSFPELCAIKNQISGPTQDRHSSTILTNFRVSDAIPHSQKDQANFSLSLSQKIVHWAGAQNVETEIRKFAEPWRTDFQLTHLAALAYTGDFTTLMDYQTMFKRKKSANFHPYIGPAMIDRAWDIALERA